MEKMDNPNQPFSDTTKRIAGRFALEAGRAFRTKPENLLPPRDRKAVDFNDYKKAVYEMLGLDPEKLLTEEMLQKRIAYIMQDSNLKFHFPQGSRCFPAIVPFSNLGNPLSAQEIQNGDYLGTFIVNKSGKTINGFGSGASYVGDFFPAEIQNTGFTIGKYEQPGDYDITDNDRKNLAVQYTQAFRKLQQLLKS